MNRALRGEEHVLRYHRHVERETGGSETEQSYKLPGMRGIATRPPFSSHVSYGNGRMFNKRTWAW